MLVRERPLIYRSVDCLTLYPGKKRVWYPLPAHVSNNLCRELKPLMFGSTGFMVSHHLVTLTLGTAKCLTSYVAAHRRSS